MAFATGKWMDNLGLGVGNLWILSFTQFELIQTKKNSRLTFWSPSKFGWLLVPLELQWVYHYLYFYQPGKK
ncbi:hypothetical protein MKW98_019498 [Papaver atlanticum]|uniref:Uncharacterized protein n=1 Tax=Papaver atlanticum TaxID=357466 RepID=A0AAD4X9L3_9MAGN|nr:hypothetical protein MKW98_019498 [Papaver atlanticum]